MERMEILDELIDSGEYRGPEQLTGRDGLDQSAAQAAESSVRAGLSSRSTSATRRRQAPDGRAKRRNGTRAKTLRTSRAGHGRVAPRLWHELEPRVCRRRPLLRRVRRSEPRPLRRRVTARDIRRPCTSCTGSRSRRG